MNIEVKDVEREDLPAILALQKLAYQSEADLYPDISIPPMVQTIEELHREFAESTMLKVEIDGVIVASVRGSASQTGTAWTWSINKLMVHPQYQRLGIGGRLMAAMEETGKVKGCSRLELFTSQKSERNLTLYRKLGYKPFLEKRVNGHLTLVYLEKAAGTGTAR